MQSVIVMHLMMRKLIKKNDFVCNMLENCILARAGTCAIHNKKPSKKYIVHNK